MGLVSVIIPCYNVSKYIDRCMETIVNQTVGIENLEIILVNDASTDDTLQKLYNWEKRYTDNIIVVTYEENLRQGGARNIGIRYASSDYIGFVDADDWVELNMYQLLYNKVLEDDYDKVSGKFIRNHSVGKAASNESESGSICTSIFKKDIIVNNEVYFPEKIAYEDNYWGEVLRIYIKKYCEIDNIVYHYFTNPNSTVSTRNALHHMDRLDIEIGIIEEYIKRGVFEKYKEELELGFIQRFYLNTLFIIFTRMDVVPDIMGDLKKTIYKYFPNYRENVGLKNCTEREKVLLRLLDLPHDLTVDEMERIKSAYLKTVVKGK